MYNDVRFEPLAGHPREAFSCSYRPIQHYFRKWAADNHDAYAQRVYVACADGGGEPIGFYALTLMTFESSMETKANAKYKDRKVPTIYIAALAREKNKSEAGFGNALLTNAFERCLEVRERVGVYAVSLHAANEKVAGIYEGYGFERFHDGACMKDKDGNEMPAMFMRLADIAEAFAQA
jgi:ribosomal protein S18 acetylase RimI-like enzyme